MDQLDCAFTMNEPLFCDLLARRRYWSVIEEITFLFLFYQHVIFTHNLQVWYIVSCYFMSAVYSSVFSVPGKKKEYFQPFHFKSVEEWGQQCSATVSISYIYSITHNILNCAHNRMLLTVKNIDIYSR